MEVGVMVYTLWRVEICTPGVASVVGVWGRDLGSVNYLLAPAKTVCYTASEVIFLPVTQASYCT